MASGTQPGGLAGAAASEGVLGTMAGLLYPVYRRLFDEDDDFVERVDRKLDEALRDRTVELFLSRAVAIGLLAAVALAVTGWATAWAVASFAFTGPPVIFGLALSEPWLGIINALKIPVLVVGSGLVLGGIGFAAGFGTPIALLYLEADDRAREINVLLPDATAYMYALSVGGMNQLEIMEAVADSDDVYGEVAREFQTILQETRYFDTDYRTAVRNRALETPSGQLSGFLTDMLSIINSGGDMTQFLDGKAEIMMRDAKNMQEKNLETLELFGEMYLTISMLPLLLIILLVTMAMLGDASDLLLYLTVYALIPGIGAVFLVLVSIFKQDDHGGGHLSGDGETVEGLTSGDSVLDRTVTRSFADRNSDQLFDDIYRRETLHRVKRLLTSPQELFIERPLSSVVVTVPIAAALVAWLVVSGLAPTTWDGVVDAPVWGTVVYGYLPMYVVLGPLAVFDGLHQRRRRGLLDELSEALRKLSSANDTGMNLLESFRNVAETSTGKLAREFERIHVTVNYGADLKNALIAFNNRYRVPRMARTVNLIAEAQEASSQISDVLRTAARASENHDEIEQERKTRTQMQLAIIIMTFLTLLGVMALLKVQFLDVVGQLAETAADAEGSGSGSGSGGSGAPTNSVGNVDVNRLSMLFFHAVTLQAVSAGLISGYLREARVLAGVKFVVALATASLLIWIPL
ncbi:flagella assembly protein j [Halobacteriales archaeon QS_9_70_65]|nr:MAG: flagella assembly protein j [Halobacteriales archaeon QS_9_70_65]